MEQLRRALRYVAQFCARMFFPPVSFLHTRATREYTLLPQFMYSTAVSRKKKNTYSAISKDPTKLGSEKKIQIKLKEFLKFNVQTATLSGISINRKSFAV